MNTLALFVWASLVPPLPMLALSRAVEGPAPLAAIAALPVEGWAAVIYVALASTVLGYSLWGALLARHRAAQVAPFALLVPVVGVAVAAIVLGERPDPLDWLGGAVILAGLALLQLGGRRGPALQGRAAPLTAAGKAPISGAWTETLSLLIGSVIVAGG